MSDATRDRTASAMDCASGSLPSLPSRSSWHSAQHASMRCPDVIPRVDPRGITCSSPRWRTASTRGSSPCSCSPTTMSPMPRRAGPILSLPRSARRSAEVHQVFERPPHLTGSENDDDDGPGQSRSAQEDRRDRAGGHHPAGNQQRRQGGELGVGAPSRQPAAPSGRRTRRRRGSPSDTGPWGGRGHRTWRGGSTQTGPANRRAPQPRPDDVTRLASGTRCGSPGSKATRRRWRWVSSRSNPGLR